MDRSVNISPINLLHESGEASCRSAFEVLVGQIHQLIVLRWLAVGLIVIGTWLGTTLFPVLSAAMPLLILAGVLLACNLSYAVLEKKGLARDERCARGFALTQIEMDLLVLSAVLHVSGGVMNPFFLFYIFHVIVATIILPRGSAFVVGLTTIVLFGLLAANELHHGLGFGYFPLQLSSGSGIWRNPVYVLGAFLAFVFTVIIAQHLTGMIIVRMTSKEWEAAQNSHLLRAIINAMSEGVLFVSCAGEVTLCNPAAQRWLRASGDLPGALLAHIEALIHSDGDHPHEKIEFNTAGSEPRFIEASSCEVVGPGQVHLGYVIVGQDLTEHKKLTADLTERSEELATLNEMLRMSRVKMAQREKMVAIGQMAAGIAHEIGNPLASLSSVAQYLNRKIQTPAEKQQLGLIQSQVGRISKILKRMLSLARPATTEYRWTDLDELIESTLSLVKFDRRMKNVTIRNEAVQSLPHVWINPQGFEQVLINVFINAMDAMAARTDEVEHILEITRSCDQDRIELRIRDTGIGMSAEVAQQAFESFFTTKEIGKGTGLGLYISYNLLTEIDGSIALESQPGEGTTVVIRLPIRPRNELLTDRAESDVGIKA